MGGLVFMVNNKMCVRNNEGRSHAEDSAGRIRARSGKKWLRVMDFTGKPLKGFVLVSEEGFRRNKDFSYWLGLALAFNKKAKAYKKKK